MQIRQPSGRNLLRAAGEIPVAVQPRLVGRVDAGEQRRMNAFAGRALTAPLLHAEQNQRSRRIALLNRALSAGVVEGLALAFFEADIAPIGSVADPAPEALDLDTPRRMTLDAGLALAANGEEVAVPMALDFDALDLPVMAPGWLLAGETPLPGPADADGSALDSRHLGLPLRDELAAGHQVPRVGIVVLEPVEHWQVEGADPFDQCERDLEAEAFEDQQRRDAGRLVYYAWPDEWLASRAPDAAWRNRLAWQIFGREAQLGVAQAMPWHRIGVPLALVAFNAAWQPLFADRAAVVRAGGRPRGQALLAAARRAGDDSARRIAASGERFLWQARIEQLSEHLAEASLAGADIAAMRAQLRLLPPAGLLPIDAVDVRARRNHFFPPTLDLFAAPVPLEQLDLLLEEAAGLGAIDLSMRDRLSVFVPVPQAVFEPDLLVIEQADPTGEIGRTLSRFVDVRADWLRRRQNLRGKQHQLRLGVDGSEGTPPLAEASDDPLRLEDESLAPTVPAPAGLLHRSALVSGLHQHVLEAAPTPLEVAADGTLYAWVQIDRENPPQQLMLQFFAASWEHRAYWGANKIGWGSDGTASRRLQSVELPPAGVWTRLAVPAADLGLGDKPITGIAFTLFDGRACFGPAGTLDGSTETVWLDEDLLSDSTARGSGEGWDLVPLPERDAPFEAAFGTRAVEKNFEAEAVAELLAGEDVKSLKIIPPGTDRAAAPTLATLIGTQGLSATVADLAARVDEADDALNLGYLRVQTDLYRLRQSVLKQSQATRFAVSPALTQIADLDNATATREQLADFYQDVRADKTILKRDSSPTAPTPAPAPRASAAAIGGIGSTTVFSNTGFGAGVRATPAPAPAVFGGVVTERLDAGLVSGVFAKAPAPSVGTIIGADALTGKAEIRTTSIAARMERPRSIEAKDFTVATRADIISKLAALGLDMDDLDVHGIADEGKFDSTGQPLRGEAVKLSALRANNFAAVLRDPDPEADKADEAAFFFSGVDLSDYTVALLRNAEGIVRRYRDALERMRKTLETTQGLLRDINSRLGVVARELAEARQDVATARALLAEDEQRARDLNAHRDEVIAEHVKFLAYSRVRVAARSVDSPSRWLDSALEPDVVPACLAAHDNPPDDVLAMLALLRRAPLDWFPAMRPHLQLIDQPALADRLIAALQTPVASTLALNTSAPAKQASMLALRAQSDSVMLARATALPQAQAALQAGAGVRAKVDLFARAASLGDLLGGAAESSELKRRAAAEFERIESIAACLHERLSRVRAAIRLQWAEAYSQFDAARGQADLGDLSGLPRFGELPREEREDLRELAAWLQGRADRNNPQAVALLADLVRVCLLAASHSPTGELVAGRIVRPLPLNPGLRLDVRALLPDRVRIGMQLQFFEANEVAARAVVEDLSGDVASVRVTQTVRANLATSLATTVNFLTR
ncbi:hypothetical protein [Piscinibacter sakaiensis]|uniref:hypothetical protein n=1 Tax=Piscinibacter sakaiensis TaxID=1547922 RepID=UPI003AAA5F5A